MCFSACRPSARPKVFYHDFLPLAGSWDRSRRVVAKVEWHQGELFPRVGFIVTNLSRAAEKVVRFYNKRGVAEGWIKEGKYALSWTRLSWTRLSSNQVGLVLFILAYNLGLDVSTCPRDGRIMASVGGYEKCWLKNHRTLSCCRRGDAVPRKHGNC